MVSDFDIPGPHKMKIEMKIVFIFLNHLIEALSYSLDDISCHCHLSVTLSLKGKARLFYLGLFFICQCT